MRKVRYGVIGIKGVGRYHCRAAFENENLELRALCDVDEAFVRAQAEEMGARAFTDFRALLAANEVDAVSIATPHHLHFPIAAACLEAGVHVLLEKPFTTRVADADRLIALAKTQNLKLGAGYQYRTFATPQVMKRVLDDGALGTIRRVLWTWSEFRPESYYARDAWRTSWQDAGGGVLINQAIHDLDLLCWLLGRPLEVCALLANQLHEAPVEDIACANVRFENGALASFQATINQPKAFSVRQIVGDKGLLVLPDVQSLSDDKCDDILLGTYEKPAPDMMRATENHHEQPAITWQTLRRRPLPAEALAKRKLKGAAYRIGALKRPPANGSGLRALIHNFALAIQTGAEPLVTGESARTAVELANAIVLSALRGKTVSLPLDAAEYDALLAELADGRTQVLRLRSGQADERKSGERKGAL